MGGLASDNGVSADVQHTVATDKAVAAPPPQKVTVDGTAPDQAHVSKQAGAQPAGGAAGAGGAQPHGSGGHVAFLKVAEEDKMARAQARKRWRDPLYRLPVGAICHTCAIHQRSWQH